MNEFFLKYGGEILTLAGSIITALIARWQEKKSLRKAGELKDKIYFAQNGFSKVHRPDKQ